MLERMTLRLMPRSMSQSVHVKRSGQYMKLWSRISIAVPMKMTCTIFMCVVRVSVGSFRIFLNAMVPMPIKTGVSSKAKRAK